MAIIDIDRHILTEITRNRLEMKKQLKVAERAMGKARELNERNDALYRHIVSEIEEYHTGRGTETSR